MFDIGDKIVHPMHGAGVIDSNVEKSINGVSRHYYSMKLPATGMLVMIPTDHCTEIGIRPIVDPDRARQILSAFLTIEVECVSNWNQRYRENMLRLKSGNLMEVARVVKSLMIRDRQRGLSTGERKMLHTARQIFISELVLTQTASLEEIESQIDLATAGQP